MERHDDRTAEQRETHTIGIVARDKFMSGWGKAGGGVSRCGWACDTEAKADVLEAWVRNRSEMRNVARVDLRTWKPAPCAHFHLYVASDDHPALARARADLEPVKHDGDEAARKAAARHGMLTLSNVISRRICDETRGWIDWSGEVSEAQKGAIVELLGHRARTSTKLALGRAAADNFRRVKNCGILERVQITTEGAFYCAGQDYRSEVALVRTIVAEGY